MRYTGPTHVIDHIVVRVTKEDFVNKMEKMAAWAARSEVTEQGVKVLVEAMVYPNGTKTNPNEDLIFVAHPDMPANERIPCNSMGELHGTLKTVARLARAIHIR